MGQQTRPCQETISPQLDPSTLQMRASRRIESERVQGPRADQLAVNQQGDVVQIQQPGLGPAVGARNFEDDVIDLRRRRCGRRGRLQFPAASAASSDEGGVLPAGGSNLRMP